MLSKSTLPKARVIEQWAGRNSTRALMLSWISWQVSSMSNGLSYRRRRTAVRISEEGNQAMSRMSEKLQPDMFGAAEAYARRTDPNTSEDAADSIRDTARLKGLQ